MTIQLKKEQYVPEGQSARETVQEWREVLRKKFLLTGESAATSTAFYCHFRKQVKQLGEKMSRRCSGMSQDAKEAYALGVGTIHASWLSRCGDAVEKLQFLGLMIGPELAQLTDKISIVTVWNEVVFLVASDIALGYDPLALYNEMPESTYVEQQPDGSGHILVPEMPGVH